VKNEVLHAEPCILLIGGEQDTTKATSQQIPVCGTTVVKRPVRNVSPVVLVAMFFEMLIIFREACHGDVCEGYFLGP
jgi:hypothetical protein